MFSRFEPCCRSRCSFYFFTIFCFVFHVLLCVCLSLFFCSRTLIQLRITNLNWKCFLVICSLKIVCWRDGSHCMYTQIGNTCRTPHFISLHVSQSILWRIYILFNFQKRILILQTCKLNCVHHGQILFSNCISWKWTNNIARKLCAITQSMERKWGERQSARDVICAMSRQLFSASLIKNP